MAISVKAFTVVGEPDIRVLVIATPNNVLIVVITVKAFTIVGEPDNRVLVIGVGEEEIVNPT